MAMCCLVHWLCCVKMHNIPDCGMVLATLAAAERLLVLGEPVGALLVVSCKQQFISQFTHMDPAGRV